MMGRIPGDVRGGLLELFYGVYNRDSDRCLEALITMGVLVSVFSGAGGGRRRFACCMCGLQQV